MQPHPAKKVSEKDKNGPGQCRKTEQQERKVIFSDSKIAVNHGYFEVYRKMPITIFALGSRLSALGLHPGAALKPRASKPKNFR